MRQKSGFERKIIQPYKTVMLPNHSVLGEWNIASVTHTNLPPKTAAVKHNKCTHRTHVHCSIVSLETDRLQNTEHRKWL